MGGDIIAGLSCLVVGTTESLADDLAIYLAHNGALVEQVADITAVSEWIACRPPGMCIIVIDADGDAPSPDELRARSHLPPISLPEGEGDKDSLRELPAKCDTRFVVIERGQRSKPRLEDTGLVSVDGNVLTRKALLKAVVMALGRTTEPGREGESGNVMPDEVKAALAPLSREEARRRNNLILIAEDNEINQKVILQQLKLLGQTADIANNGREALELWQSGDYAILFADLHMPEMDGYELTTAIRAAEIAANEINQTRETNKARIPIIAFTANALKGEAEHCIAIGMDDYLSKPVQLVSLKAMLEKWLPVAVSAAGVGLRSANPTYGASVPAPIDVNVLKALVGDDEEIIRDFLHDFRISAEKIAVELRTACAMSAERQAAGQAAAAGALAHKLKSSARSVGALALGELCAEMEKSSKAGDAEALTMLLPKFEQELANVENFLGRY